ncbi:hypothetical protein BB561_003349 [Smittium simulii]|uniref:Reverse transcriptase domain-containing protein n=1 Tax=Smittium simulii TaxID=133385 RepID=A0A2T9YLW2_9FUNG|nr:hypothetical protein BB561_003349 [Smittium simulii]
MSYESILPNKNDNISPIIAPRGTTLDDTEFMRGEIGRSNNLKHTRYMSTLQSGAKIRKNISSNDFAKQYSDRSDNRSNSSLDYQSLPRPHSRQNERSTAPKFPINRKSSNNTNMTQQSRQNQPNAKMNPQRFMHMIQECFFSRFTNDELFYFEFKEATLKRLQDNAHRSSPEDLQDILYEVVEACRSTRLNLDAVVQWKLGRLDHTTESSVIDHIFVINVNIMCYDIRYSKICVERFCVDPLCCELHSENVAEYDKARAFLRVLNTVLNEAIRAKVITKDQKSKIRSRLAKSHFTVEDRIAIIREIALLIMLGQTDRFKDLATFGVQNVGIPWSPPPEILNDNDRECSLDPDKVFQKVNIVAASPFLETILDVKRLGLGVTSREYERLLSLWENINSQSNTSKKLTIPMLLHILVHCNESELQKVLSEAALKDNAEIQTDRVNQLEDSALQAVQNLGLAWELGDNPPRDYRQLCMAIILDLGSILSKFVIKEKMQHHPNSIDYLEIGPIEDTWFETCTLFIRQERMKKGFLISLLISYLSITSERLLSQKADFNPEIFLVISLELLMEFRKRRPNYNAITINSEKIFTQIRDPEGRPVDLDRSTKESIGSDFDRTFLWVEPNIIPSNRVRQLVKQAPSRFNSGSNSHGGSPNNTTPNNSIKTLQEAALDAAELADSINSQFHFEKAYDRVPHNQLFHKLEYSEICGKLLQVIKGLYNAPRLAVKVNYAVSDANNVILAESADELQKSFDSLTEWCKQLDMNVNNKKCGIMAINCSTDTTFKKQNQLILSVNKSKYLGIEFNDQ